jgi:hypothetical protein
MTVPALAAHACVLNRLCGDLRFSGYRRMTDVRDEPRQSRRSAIEADERLGEASSVDATDSAATRAPIRSD